MFLSKKHLSVAQDVSPTCVVTGTKKQQARHKKHCCGTNEKKKMTCFNLHFMRFTFSSEGTSVATATRQKYLIR